MKGYPLMAKRSIYWPVLVIGMSLIWLCSPALAVTRQQVQMGDPDIGNKPQSGPGQAAALPVFNSSKPAGSRPSLWIVYVRLLINTRITLR